MARVTVEDCIMHVPNYFDLVLLAAQRAKQISSGNPLTVDRDNDKDPVVSLREIAGGTIALEQLSEDIIQGFFKKPVIDTADKKLLVQGEEPSADITAVFEEEAKRHLAIAEEDAAELSFTEENIDPED